MKRKVIKYEGRKRTVEYVEIENKNTNGGNTGGSGNNTSQGSKGSKSGK